MCVQVPCVYIPHTASSVTARNKHANMEYLETAQNTTKNKATWIQDFTKMELTHDVINHHHSCFATGTNSVGTKNENIPVHDTNAILNQNIR